MKKIRHRILAAIPPAWRHGLVEFKNTIWGGYSHHFYSHCGEDVLINAYFRTLKKGFYVDVGAHHPKRYSNTALLYERGWNGINIDADKGLIKVFNRKRKRDINLHYGVGIRDEMLEFHRFSDPAVSTFSQSNAESIDKKHWVDEISAVSVHVRPLSDILDEHLQENTHIDFLNIDVEDLDLEVLKSNDWGKYRPTFVAVEDLHFDMVTPSNSEIYCFMTDHDFIFVAVVGLTLIFIDRSHLNKK